MNRIAPIVAGFLALSQVLRADDFVNVNGNLVPVSEFRRTAGELG